MSSNTSGGSLGKNEAKPPEMARDLVWLLFGWLYNTRLPSCSPVWLQPSLGDPLASTSILLGHSESSIRLFVRPIGYRPYFGFLLLLSSTFGAQILKIAHTTVSETIHHVVCNVSWTQLHVFSENLSHTFHPSLPILLHRDICHISNS